MAPSYVSPLLVHEEISDDAGLAAEELEPTARSWRACAVLAVSVLLSMSTWLSASVVLPYLTSFFHIEADDAPLLTISVQLGFVVCAVAQAVVQLPDRFNCRRLMFSGGLVACVSMIVNVSPSAGDHNESTYVMSNAAQAKAVAIVRSAADPRAAAARGFATYDKNGRRQSIKDERCAHAGAGADSFGTGHTHAHAPHTRAALTDHTRCAPCPCPCGAPCGSRTPSLDANAREQSRCRQSKAESGDGEPRHELVEAERARRGVPARPDSRASAAELSARL